MNVQAMREAREQPAVFFDKYLKEISKYNYACFVEGTDDRYYYWNLVNDLLDKTPLFISCGGKDSLVRIVSLVEKDKKDNGRTVSLMFFLDGDYGNKIKYQNVYDLFSNDLFILDYYSIENYYCSNCCVKKILLREYGVDSESQEMRYLLGEFDRLVNDTAEIYKRLNYYFYALRSCNNNINFDKIKKTDFFIINNKDGTISINDFTYQNICFSLNIEPINEEALESSRLYFENKDMQLYGRGHNQIWILQSFFKSLYIRNKRHGIKINKKIVKFSCNNDCSDEILQHCEYASLKTKELNDFIQKHFLNN